MAYLFATELRAGHHGDPANKILWITPTGAVVVVTAHPLGGDQPTVSFQLPHAGELERPSEIDLPSPGCWALTLTWPGHSAEIDLDVLPSSASPAPPLPYPPRASSA